MYSSLCLMVIITGLHVSLCGAKILKVIRYMTPLKCHLIILFAGCWKREKERECPQTNCSSHKPIPRKNETYSFYYCCCTGDFCNSNLTSYVKPPEPTTIPPFITPIQSEFHSPTSNIYPIGVINSCCSAKSIIARGSDVQVQ